MAGAHGDHGVQGQMGAAGECVDGRRHKVRRVAGEARQDAIEGCGVPYRQISRRLGIPAGSIGPTRARTLRKLADTGPVRALAS